MTAPVVPTQQDREAAAALQEALNGSDGLGRNPAKYRNGDWDRQHLVQAFAYHRLAALEEAALVADEAAAAAENVSAMGAGDGYERLSIRAAAARRLSAAIRSLKESNNG